jgi:Cof subfamily protein (haloacid dehalogenase superfamily)
VKKKIKLVALDIDNTLLEVDGTLSKNVVRKLNKIVAAGISVALISARPLHGVEVIENSLEIVTHKISCLGATVCSIHKKLSSIRIDSEIAGRIAQFADDHNISLTINIDDIEYHTQFKNRKSMITSRIVGDAKPILEKGNSPYIIAVSEPEPTIKVFNYCINNFQDQLSIVRHLNDDESINSVLITHKDANKGTALNTLSKFLSIAPSEILAIGDSESDVSMFRFAGLSIAVKNADSLTCKYATYVAPYSFGRGVIWALNKYVLNRVINV